MIRAVVGAESVDLRLSADHRLRCGVGAPVQRGQLLIGVALVSIMLTACAHQTTARPYAPWELRGTIVDVRDHEVRVRHKSGQVVDLIVDDQTAILGSEGKATLSTLTHGRRVTVNVEPLADGRARAARVRVFM
jgi:hypothetical protein